MPSKFGPEKQIFRLRLRLKLRFRTFSSVLSHGVSRRQVRHMKNSTWRMFSMNYVAKSIHDAFQKLQVTFRLKIFHCLHRRILLCRHVFVTWSIPSFRGPILHKLVVTWNAQCFRAFLFPISIHEGFSGLKSIQKRSTLLRKLASSATACVYVSLYGGRTPVALVLLFEGVTPWCLPDFGRTTRTRFVVVPCFLLSRRTILLREYRHQQDSLVGTKFARPSFYILFFLLSEAFPPKCLVTENAWKHKQTTIPRSNLHAKLFHVIDSVDRA